MKHTTSLVALLTLLFAGTHAVAQDDRAAMAKERMEQTIARLELSDEQVVQIKPILEKSMAARQEVMAKYGIDPENGGSSGRMNPRTARAMKKEMDAIGTDSLSELETILTAEQLDEYKLIQEERRAQMREQMRGSR